MASKLKIKVNGLVHSVSASLDTPLLYVLHNELHLHGPRFGCGLAQCGACSVLLDGKEIRSCVTPVAAVSGKSITTLTALAALRATEGGGAMIVGFSLLSAATAHDAHAAESPYASNGPYDPLQIDSWIAIHGDNTASVKLGKVELGQGSSTGLLMIAAEELDLDLSQML